MPDEYELFRNWFITKYGVGGLLFARVSRETYRESSYYSLWKRSLREERRVAPSKGKQPPVELGRTFEFPKKEEVTPPTITPTPKGKRQIETINGIMGLATYEDGELMDFEPFQAGLQPGAGGWRPGELEFQREQFEWQKQQAIMAQQQQWAQLSRDYSEWRGRLLSELTGPGDWITRWMVEQTPAQFPWTPPPQGEERARISASVPLVKEGEPGFGVPLWEETPPTIEQIVQRSIGGRTPLTPAWLPEFVPGLIAGRPITRQPVPTPSGQQLTRMEESKALALGGFADWAGGRPWRDILGHAELMLPRTPRGAGATRWSPMRQGVA